MPGGGAQLAVLHPREMVLPAPLSERVQRMTEPPGGGGATHNHIHLNVNAVDAKSFADYMNANSGAFSSMLAKSINGRHVWGGVSLSLV